MLTGCALAALLSLSCPASQAQETQPDAFQKGLVALRDNHIEEALDQFTSAEREHPDDARVRNFRGIVLARLQRNEQAAAEYREAIRLDPKFEDAYRNLGFLEWNLNHAEPARQALERAVQLNPDDAFAHYYLGRMLLDARNYAQAFAELDKSRLPLPGDSHFLFEVAAGYAALSRTDEARKVLDRLAALPLTDAQAVRAAGLLLDAGDNDAAVRMIRRRIGDRTAPRADWLQFDYALVLLRAGQYGEAAQEALVYTRIVNAQQSASPEAARAWSVLGIAQARLKRSEPAVAALRRAAEIAPGDEEHWLNLTRELMELNRFAEAIVETQKGIAANPKSYALQLRLGAAYLAAGRYSDSERIFRGLTAAGDPLPTSYVGLAQVLMRTGRAAEAVAELDAAQKKLGPQFLLSYFRGLTLERANKPEESLAAYRDAVRLNPQNAEARLGVGKMELSLGQVSAAIDDLEAALRLSPGDPQATRLLSRAYQRAGNAAKAAEYAHESETAPMAPENDLAGDFLLPQWQLPAEDVVHKE